MPVVNASDFLAKFTDDPTKVSRLLLWSVLFAAANFLEPASVKAAGFKTRKSLKEYCYQNAKVSTRFRGVSELWLTDACRRSTMHSKSQTKRRSSHLQFCLRSGTLIWKTLMDRGAGLALRATSVKESDSIVNQIMLDFRAVHSQNRNKHSGGDYGGAAIIAKHGSLSDLADQCGSI